MEDSFVVLHQFCGQVIRNDCTDVSMFVRLILVLCPSLTVVVLVLQYTKQTLRRFRKEGRSADTAILLLFQLGKDMLGIRLKIVSIAKNEDLPNQRLGSFRLETVYFTLIHSRFDQSLVPLLEYSIVWTTNEGWLRGLLLCKGNKIP